MARERIELNGHDESFLLEGGSVPGLARAKGPVSPAGRSRTSVSVDASTYNSRDALGLEERKPAAARDDLALRAIDLDDEEEAQFLRTQRRIPVRRGPIPKKAANRMKSVLVMLGLAGLVAGLAV